MLVGLNDNGYHSRMTLEDPKATPKPAARPASVRVLRSRDLFGAGRELRILHEGVEYRLRRTRHEKLILTK